MIRTTSTLLAAALLAGTANAQNDNYLNRMLRYGSTWAGYVFGGAIANGGDALDTLVSDEVVDFGIDNAAAPGQQLITGMQWILQDQNAGTTHQYRLVGYTEDTTIGGVPNVAAPFMNLGPFTSPTGTAGMGAAWIFTLGFTTPFQAPRERNVYVGMNLPPATSATDILLMQYIDNDTTNNNGVGGALIYSQPGQSYAGNVPGGSHLLGVAATTNLVTFAPRPASMAVEIEVRGPGGHALIMSNETANPAVTPPASTVTTPHTALYPDAINFNLASPARADTLGYLYQDNAFVQGTDIVAFVLSLSLNPLNSSTMGGPFGISRVLPGSTGNVCVDLAINTTMAVFVMPTTTGANQEQYFELTRSVPAAAVTPGIKTVMQGFTLDGALLVVRGGPCAVQTF